MPTLEERVAALEQQIQVIGTDESLTPNYLSVDANGLVSANFAGIINAFGLVLPEGGVFPFLTPGAANEIQWTDTQDNLYADLTSFRGISGIQRFLLENLQYPGGSNFGSNLRLLSRVTDNSESAEIDINTAKLDSVNTEILLSVFANGNTVTIKAIDANGTSDFLQKSLSLADVANTTGARQNIFAVGGADNSIHALLGDFALQYGTGTPAYGPGTGNPFSALTLTNAINDGARLSGASYITPNPGVYLVGMNIGVAGSGVFAGGVKNVSTGFTIVSEDSITSGLSINSCHFVGMIPCSAGQTLAPQLAVSAADTLHGTDSINGNVNASWWAGQIR